MTYPKVSLLVAMRNEGRHIERCLASLLRQDYPAEQLEILVLDGQSTDGSREIVEKMFHGRSNCRLIDNPGVVQAHAWNLGIKESTGEVVGIISAHCELAGDYVSEAVKTLVRTGADLVGGPMRPAGRGTIGQAVAIATSTPFGVGNAKFHYAEREADVDTVYMGLCWKKLYERIGGFDVSMACNEDDELSYRLLERGGRIICNPSIRSLYYNRSSFSSLWRQYYRYGYWKVRVMQKHLAQMHVRHFVPAGFVVTVGGTALLGILPPGKLLLFLPVMLLYLAANMLASIVAGYKTKFPQIHLLSLAFITLHISYGLGFLGGLVGFLMFPRKLLLEDRGVIGDRGSSSNEAA